MTTVIIDCANKTVHADKRETSFRENSFTGCKWKHYSDSKIKVTKRTFEGTRYIIAGAGDSDDMALFSSSYPASCGTPSGVHTNMVVITDQGEDVGLLIKIYKPKLNSILNRLSPFSSKYTWVEDETFIKLNGYVTLGSGGSYAMGALSAGASVEEAFKAAASNDPHTSAQYISTSFDDPTVAV